MDALISNSRGAYIVPTEVKLLSECRTVFLEKEITTASANEFKHTIMYLLHANPDGPITIHIDSPGGEISAGMEIYDAIKKLTVDVTIVCTGKAYSMAAIILAGGQKGRRVLWPHAKVLIHEPLISSGVAGSTTDIQKKAEEMTRAKRDLVDVLSSDTGKSKEEIKKAISFDNYMTPHEAIDFGIADHIATVFFDLEEDDR